MRAPAIAAAALLAACAHRPAMDAPASLAAAETAFAAHSLREDMRVAFLEAFAADGVLPRDGWVVVREDFRARPAPPIVLEWKPVHVEVARSGELGLSTGPSKITSRAKPDAPPVYGQFVSIWRRVGDGPWKVEVDLGINHPPPALWDAPLAARSVADGPPARGTLEAAEAAFAARAREAGLRQALSEHAAGDLRFYRNGHAPLLGREAALASAAVGDARQVWTVERSAVAASGDLGYARGRYARIDAPAGVEGFYLRVWRRDGGTWRVAADVVSPAPPRKPA